MRISLRNGSVWGLGLRGGACIGTRAGATLSTRGSVLASGCECDILERLISSAEIPRSNSFVGLEMRITRRDYLGIDPDRQVLPRQRLTLSQALEVYTINGARQLGISNEIGTLEAGQSADFLVVSSDLFNVPVRQIHKSATDAVVLNGKLTSGAPP